jgi:hypothetical protein
MNRTLKVLLVIAIVISTVQVGALVVDLLQTDEAATNPLSALASEAQLRWMVYSLSAVAALVMGFVFRKRHQLAGDAMVIAGVYLMLLANNGGLFARGLETYRLVSSVLTLAFLLFLAMRGQGPAGTSADA